jgi:hypothetical protein
VLTADDAVALQAMRVRVDARGILATVEALARPRNRFDAREAIADSEAVLTAELADLGWAVEHRPYHLDKAPTVGFRSRAPAPPGARLDGVNIVATREGLSDRSAVVVLAHYDAAAGSPGADDNASGAAVLLEVARLLGDRAFARSVILALPDMEEVGLFGARVLASELVRDRHLLGVLCLECVGYTTQEAGSQTGPAGVRLLFPAQCRRIGAKGWRGDFVQVIYRGTSATLSSRFAAAIGALDGRDRVIQFRDPGDLPILGRLLQRVLPAVRDFSRSDHRAFWDVGVPAVMISDTAPFRNANYHTPTDTPDTLDVEYMALVAAATAHTVASLAERLGTVLASAAKAPEPASP